MDARADRIPLRERSPRAFWLGVAGAVVSLAVTGYLATLTVLWRLHIETLRAEQSELALLEAERTQRLADQEEQLTELQADLSLGLRAVTESAHEKAVYEDLRYVYDDYAHALKGCADERAQVLYYVQTRYTERWVLWQVHQYDDEVAIYCWQVKAQWAATVTEEDW